MLTACKTSNCATTHDKVAFTYDAEGHRTQIVSDPAGTGAGQGPSTWDLRYQDDAIVEERLTDATHTAALVRSYVVDDSGTVVRMTIAAGEPGAGTYIPVWNGHGDALNLSRLESDGSLTLANSYRYDTWGKPTTATHNSIVDLGFRFTYVGEFDVQWDDQLGLSLLYMHARHYSPALGRFVQPDPDRSEANLYRYAANNPVTELDPDGTCFIVCQLVFGAIVDSVVYLATTDNASFDGLAKAVVGGAIESAINPFAKLNKVAKLAKAATKIIAKLPKAGRVARLVTSKSGFTTWRTPNGRFAKNPHASPKPPRSSKHGNSYDSDRETILYAARNRRTGEFRKYGITADINRRYSARDKYDLREIMRGSRRQMAAEERKRVIRFGGPDNREPWSRWRRFR